MSGIVSQWYNRAAPAAGTKYEPARRINASLLQWRRLAQRLRGATRGLPHDPAHPVRSPATAYAVDGIGYLPDFELPRRLWVDVKGAYAPPVDAWRKAALVVLGFGRVLMFWSGDDWLSSGLYILVRNTTVFLGYPPRETLIDPERDCAFEHGDRVITIRRRAAFWTICRHCNSPGLVVSESSTGWCFGCDTTESGDRHHPHLELAARAALAVQFERMAQAPPYQARGYAVLRPDRFRRK